MERILHQPSMPIWTGFDAVSSETMTAPSNRPYIK